MSGHRWSGWPGAWCLDCGQEDLCELALAEGRCDDEGLVTLTAEEGAIMATCPEPGSKRHDPSARRAALEQP